MRFLRRRERHQHTWTKWQTGTINGSYARTGAKVSWDIQQRRCTECGYMEREDL